MFQSLKQLNHLRLYQNTQQLNTSSFLRFVQSVFQIVPRWFWFYIVLVSIVFPFEIGKEPFFVPLSAPPIMTQLVHLYTFIVMILSPLTLTYIRFVKSISFTRFYWGLVKHEDRFTERHNQRIREKRGKVYADDRYAFNYNRRNGHWTATNIDAEKRNRRAEMGNGAWFIAMGYLGFLLFFVGAYMIIMYFIIVPVAIGVVLHRYYKYQAFQK